jgi:hypothetical protein
LNDHERISVEASVHEFVPQIVCLIIPPPPPQPPPEVVTVPGAPGVPTPGEPGEAPSPLAWPPAPPTPAPPAPAVAIMFIIGAAARVSAREERACQLEMLRTHHRRRCRPVCGAGWHQARVGERRRRGEDGAQALRVGEGAFEVLGFVVVREQREEVHGAAAAQRVHAVDQHLRRLKLRAGYESGKAAAACHDTPMQSGCDELSRLEEAGDGVAKLVDVHLSRQRVELHRVPAPPQHGRGVSIAIDGCSPTRALNAQATGAHAARYASPLVARPRENTASSDSFDCCIMPPLVLPPASSSRLCAHATAASTASASSTLRHAMGSVARNGSKVC